MAALYTSNSRPDSLKADAYIMYMILGSYFKSCKCDNSILEKRLFLNYKDLSLNKQYAREEKIIAKVDRLDENFLEQFADVDAKVRINFIKDSADVIFYADDKVFIKASVDKKGTMEFLA